MSENHLPFLRNVYLSADVYGICLQHALSTEKEEVMGLLIGEVDQENAASHISACIILHRSDKQPDRVEISPEQLCEASNYADELAAKLNKPMRVLGWYHSHPHITVCPSHVDLGTQSTYQFLDQLFVGLIFSVYGSESRTISSKVEVTCFQARGNSNDLHRREIALTIKPSGIHNHNLKAMTDLPKILMKEVSDQFGEINDSEDELTKLHNNALKTLQLTEITSKITLPMCDFLEMRLNSITTRLKELQLLKESLKMKVEANNRGEIQTPPWFLQGKVLFFNHLSFFIQKVSVVNSVDMHKTDTLKVAPTDKRQQEKVKLIIYKKIYNETVIIGTTYST